MTEPRYPWASGDYLELRPNYSYADCLADDFPAAWAASRRQALAQLGSPAGQTPLPTAVADAERDAWPIDDLLAALRLGLGETGRLPATTRRRLDFLVQRFEAGKRLYAVYRGAELRGDTASDYRDLSRYVRFGEVLLIAWQRDACLSDLNALLKLSDLLCAHAETIAPDWRGRAAAVLAGEATAMAGLAARKEVAWTV